MKPTATVMLCTFLSAANPTRVNSNFVSCNATRSSSTTPDGGKLSNPLVVCADEFNLHPSLLSRWSTGAAKIGHRNACEV